MLQGRLLFFWCLRSANEMGVTKEKNPSATKVIAFEFMPVQRIITCRGDMQTVAENNNTTKRGLHVCTAASASENEDERARRRLLRI